MSLESRAVRRSAFRGKDVQKELDRLRKYLAVLAMGETRMEKPWALLCRSHKKTRIAAEIERVTGQIAELESLLLK